MNISKPVASSLESVEFTFLTTDEIHAISARRIENEQTFDNLNNPIQGGLYDPALGSWSDSHRCATCNLVQAACPGHPGHIDLPIPVYHPVFMDQLYRLLRAQCRRCAGFRPARNQLHRYASILRLLQHGLLREAQMIDAIGPSDLGDEIRHIMLPDAPVFDLEEAEDEYDSTMESVIRQREAFVQQSIRDNRRKGRTADLRQGKHEGALAMRREVIKEFLAAIIKDRKCHSCGHISPTYRKDRFVKIFEKSQNAKEAASNANSNSTRVDALELDAGKAKKRGAAGEEYSPGEDLAEVVGSSASGGSDEEGEGEDLDEMGGVVKSRTSTKSGLKEDGGQQRFLPTSEIRARLNLLFEREQDLLFLLYNSKPQRQPRKLTADMFFLQTLLVPPNRYRPEAVANDKVQEAQQNKLYQLILRSSSKVAQMARDRQEEAERNIQNPRGMALFYEACTDLQDCVNSLIDRTKNPVSGPAARRNEDGIKQKLEKKEGLFRKNMMGKRVNYAARSVISPDPNIDTNEIGVPPVFACKLTYPEPVTSHNFKELQQAVINGPTKWPGATAIEMESGQVIHLGRKSQEDRIALANQLLAPTSASAGGARNKKVHRHISNGDVVLMNRQPTLHKPSIMGHRVRVLPGERTIRMHYANCNTYNADFDGDEMNMHFPQNEIARAEALQLADTDHQYMSGTAGKPLRGLIQDHLSVSVALCNKDTFFDRDTYHQLIYSALRPEHGHIMGERIKLVPPTVVKPVALWTGKQVVTTILKNMRPPNCGDLWMNGHSKVKGDRWGKGSEEGQVMFRDGEFVSGILDKNQLGPESGGFIHAVHEVYGPATASKLLSAMGRLLTKYLHMRAFTCGMDDLRMTPAGEQDRKDKLEAASRVGLEVAARYVSLQDQNPKEDDPELLRRLEEVMRDDKKQEGLDLLMNQGCSQLSSEITKTCLPAGLTKQFPKNQMQAMTTSGAKGGPVNANLISCNLGQQVLEGRRVPVMISGKTLPCFKPFDTNVRAGGYVVNRFLTGIRPQEYFFHLMAGREGLIDTAVKTSRSGYLQRCIIKGMEGLEIAYDSSVRDSDGSVCQFLYGEDGLDITKQKYLNDFEFLLHNRDSQLAQTGYADANDRSLFENKDHIVKTMKDIIKSTRGHRAAQDPLVSVLDPSRFAFATSESFFKAMTKYTKENPQGLIKEKGTSTSASTHQVARKTAEKLFALKYLRSLVEPGEAVGIVAGQSIGEPSTQMTLNTFHLAGHSAKNVTLGIPRLREVLMTASAKISTPTMTLFLNKELSHADGERFARAISVLSLADVLDKATVRERIDKGGVYSLAKIYDVRLNFFPSSEYTKTYAIGISDLAEAVQNKFLPELETRIKKALKKASKAIEAAAPEIGVKTRAEPTGAGAQGRVGGDGAGGEDDEDDDADGDDDATNAKQRANRSEAVSYGPNDDEDDEVQNEMQRGVESDSDDEDDGHGARARDADKDGESDDEEKSREDNAKSKNKHVTRYHFDKQKGYRCDITLEFDASIPKLLMVVIVQDAIKNSLIQQIAGVRKCTFVADEKILDPRTGENVSTPVIHTEGANLRAMQQYGDYINPNRIATNDIAAILETYGVEACRANIVREIGSVFKGHGISVDPRHLNLIGDYMTRNGGFSPFNRMGLAGNISPFTKMSFETTLSFLKDAVLDGDWDGLNAPSSRLVVGKLGKVGTGLFDVYTNTPTRHLDTVQAAA